MNKRVRTGRQEYVLREVALRGSVRSVDIAERLGVSETTVRRDVIELDAQGLLARVHGGAVAVTSAKRPRAEKTLVGVVLPDTAYHFRRSVDGMNTAAAGLGARLVVAVSDFRADRERQHIERLLALGVHGLIVSPTHRDTNDGALVDVLDGARVPVVLFERAFDQSEQLSHFDSVRTDDVRGGMMAVEHLAQAGHRGIALAIYDRTPTAPLIREGYERAVAHLGGAPAVYPLPKGDDDPAALDEALAGVLDEITAQKFKAIVVHTDRHASRLIELASDRGVRVPDDLAIVAYDDIFAEHALVPLTAITAPRRDLGELTIRMLLERVAEQRTTRIPRHMQLLPQLTPRRSSAVSHA